MITLFSVLLISFLANNLPIETISVIHEASAENKEFEIEKYEQNIIIPTNNYKSVDINFKKGKELEVVFSIQVKDNLPIDIWFVNEDNYLLLSNEAQFLFFIDGTAQKLSYLKRIVMLKEHDNYKLVMTNYYANQSVELDLTFELRTYNADSNDFKMSPLLLYSLIIILVILAFIIVNFFLRIHRFKKENGKNSVKTSSKRYNKGIKTIKNNTNRSNKNPSKKPEEGKNIKGNKKSPRKSPSKSGEALGTTNYCGNCGESVDTKFCKNCGYKM